jgi:recombination protein RecT
MTETAVKAPVKKAAQSEPEARLPAKGEVGNERAMLSLMKGLEGEIAKVLASHLTPARFIRQAILAVRKNPKLLKCDQASFGNAILTAAERSLELGYHAHLVPYKTDCVLIPDYKGLIDLARRTSKVRRFYSVPVFSGDVFKEIQGLHPNIIHVPQPGGSKHAKNMTHVYAVIEFSDGAIDFEVMDRAQVDAIRARSRAANDGPWVTDYVEMARKCPIKRLSKRVPMSNEFRDLVALDNEPDGEEILPAQVVDRTQLDAPPPKTRYLEDAVKPEPKPHQAPPAEPPLEEERREAPVVDSREEPAREPGENEEPGGNPLEPTKEELLEVWNGMRAKFTGVELGTIRAAAEVENINIRCTREQLAKVVEVAEEILRGRKG